LFSPDAQGPDVSNVTLQGVSEVFGNVMTTGTVLPSSQAVVHGGINQDALVELPAMPATSIPAGSGESFTLNTGQTRAINPARTATSTSTRAEP